MTREQLNKLNSTLGRYKSAKQKLEKRVIQAENWWKLRNSFEEKRSLFTPADAGFHSTTGWLHNVIVNKHADAIDSFPAPVILPREPGDKKEAEILSEIIPCVLEQNRFEEVYSNVCWQKLKTGTGVYKVIWDQSNSGSRALQIYRDPNMFSIHSLRTEKSLKKCIPPLRASSRETA